MKNNSFGFKNTECEFFPCHKNTDDHFNCMFCYCPLYTLGDKCGGNFKITSSGIKDCSDCLIPHSEKGYNYILSKMNDVSDLAKKNCDIKK